MFNEKVHKTYDLFELMEYMETKGFMTKIKYWRDYVLESYNVSNDSFVHMTFSEGYDEELNEYHEEVRRLLGIGNDESVLMEISW